MGSLYPSLSAKLFQKTKSSTRKQNPGGSKCFSNKCEKERAAAVSITISASRKKFWYLQNLGTDGAPGSINADIKFW
jgi:hypothetical protein